MKIAILNDTHAGVRGDMVAMSDYQGRFYKEIFFPYLIENDIKHIIHLGDYFDRRKYINFSSLKANREHFIKPMLEAGISMDLIIGNHDTYYKNTNEVNAVQELVGNKYDNIKYYTESDTVSFDDTQIHFVPWINSENYGRTIQSIKETSATICMGHLEINGFEMHKGHFSENGYPKEIFKSFPTVFSGHFHKKSDDGQIYYVGSTYQMTWSDDNCPKGFHIFDTETRELLRIYNPYTIFEKIYYDDTQTDYSKVETKQYRDKFIKLVVVNKKDLYQFDKFTDRLLQEQTHEVKIVEDFSELDASNVSDEIVENAQDTTTLLEKYVDDLDVDLNKQRLKNTLKSLYLEACDLEI